MEYLVSFLTPERLSNTWIAGVDMHVLLCSDVMRMIDVPEILSCCV
jgi:hypothetical protein